MEFILSDLDHSVHDIVGLIGYVSLKHEHEEFIMVRKIGKKPYPRFYLAVKIINGGDRGHHFALWLENSSRRNEKVDNDPAVEKEMERIRALLMDAPK